MPRRATAKVPPIESSTIPVERVFHAFDSLFRVVAETRPVLGNHKSSRDPYNHHLRALQKCCEEELWHEQRTMPEPQCDIHDPAGYSARFADRIKDAIKETFEKTLGLSRNDAETATAALQQSFVRNYYRNKLASEETTDHLNSPEMAQVIKSVVGRRSGNSRHEFALTPSSNCPDISVRLSRVPEQEPNLVFFGVPTGPYASAKGEPARLRYIHFHALGGCLVHEVLCHCIIQGKAASDLTCIRDSLYVSHGWVAYYAYIRAEFNLVTKIGVQTGFHSGVGREVENMLSNNLKDEVSREGYESARRFFEALNEHSFIADLQKRRKDHPRYADADMAAFGYAVSLFTEFLRAALDQIVNDQAPARAERILRALVDSMGTSRPSYFRDEIRDRLTAFFSEAHSDFAELIGD